jgi:hypothetical protein
VDRFIAEVENTPILSLQDRAESYTKIQDICRGGSLDMFSTEGFRRFVTWAGEGSPYFVAVDKRSKLIETYDRVRNNNMCLFDDPLDTTHARIAVMYDSDRDDDRDDDRDNDRDDEEVRPSKKQKAAGSPPPTEYLGFS